MISLLGGKIKDLFSHSKHRSNYPAVKIGRLGVFLKYQHSRIGSDILNFVKDMFTVNNRTGCSFITVDALCPAASSYIKTIFCIWINSRQWMKRKRRFCFIMICQD